MTNREAVEVLATAAIQTMTQQAEWRLPEDTPLNCVTALIVVAESLGCKVRVEPGCIPSYSPGDLAGDPFGVAMVNPVDATMGIVRQLAHEIGHHIVWWVLYCPYPSVQNVQDAYRQVSCSTEVEEEICRTIADLVQALPGGIQWNGKIGVPRVGVKIWSHERRPIPAMFNMPASEID